VVDGCNSVSGANGSASYTRGRRAGGGYCKGIRSMFLPSFVIYREDALIHSVSNRQLASDACSSCVTPTIHTSAILILISMLVSVLVGAYLGRYAA
jgi:hypothetical protein